MATLIHDTRPKLQNCHDNCCQCIVMRKLKGLGSCASHLSSTSAQVASARPTSGNIVSRKATFNSLHESESAELSRQMLPPSHHAETQGTRQLRFTCASQPPPPPPGPQKGMAELLMHGGPLPNATFISLSRSLAPSLCLAVSSPYASPHTARTNLDPPL